MVGKIDYIALTQAAFDKLPTYSLSLPTATTIGKQWKSHNANGWFMGEYAKSESPDKVRIIWRKIEIREAGLTADEIVGSEEAYRLWLREKDRRDSDS